MKSFGPATIDPTGAPKPYIAICKCNVQTLLSMFSKEKAMKAEQMRRYLNTPLCHSCQYVYGKQQAFHDLHK